MMNKNRIAIAICCVVAAGVLYVAYTSIHAGPMNEMRSRLASWSGGKSQMQSSLRDSTRVREELKAIADTTLGNTPELAEHRLRTLLTELCTSAELSEYVIACKEPKPIGNPAANEKPVEFSREMRRLADCIIQETTITGQGSYEACVQTIAMLEAQPWLARVSNVSIQPAGKERKLYSLVVGVTSIVMPDLAEDTTGESAYVHDIGADRLAQSMVRNPFVATAPNPVVVARDDSPPPAPKLKPKPYGDWLVSGVMQTPTGGETILSNSKTGASRSLGLGGQILGLTIDAIEGHYVMLSEGESGYRVALGQSLAEREPVIE